MQPVLEFIEYLAT